MNKKSELGIAKGNIIRQCKDCNYKTVILKDDISIERKCRSCHGDLEVIMESER